MADETRTQYLDLAGAQYLWNKICNQFATKQEISGISEQDQETLDAYILQVENIPGTDQSIEFENSLLKAINHTSGSQIVRRDVFTFGKNSLDQDTITEERTLYDGSKLTIVTNLNTLVTQTTYTGGLSDGS